MGGDRVDDWDVERHVRRGYGVAPKKVWAGVTAVSNDGQLVLSMADFSRDAYVWERTSGLLSAHITTPNNVRSAAFSPDGTLVAFAPDGGPGVRVLFFHRDGAAAGEVKAPGFGASNLLFTPDGNRILVTSQNGQNSAGEFDLSTARPTAVYASLPNDVPTRYAYSADGSRLLGVGPLGVTIWDTKAATRVAHVPASHVTAAALTPDGHRLVYGTRDTNLRFVDLATQREIARYDEPTEAVWWIAVSPDGTRVLTAGDLKVVRMFAAPKE